MRAAFEFVAHPFHACLCVVFRVGEEIIQIVALVAVHFAVFATALHSVEVIAEVLFELADAQGIHAGGLAGHVLALTPIGEGHRVRVVKGQAPSQYFGRSRMSRKRVRGNP